MQRFRIGLRLARGRDLLFLRWLQACIGQGTFCTIIALSMPANCSRSILPVGGALLNIPIIVMKSKAYSKMPSGHATGIAVAWNVYSWFQNIHTPMASQLFPGIAPMLSRKQFFKDLLSRGIRAVNDLTVGDEGRSSACGEPGFGFDLRATELSPSLLAIEAECRGIDLQADQADELRREIYQELTQNGPGWGPANHNPT
jgi:hypothetical protein